MRNVPRGDCTYHGHGAGRIHVTITSHHGRESRNGIGRIRDKSYYFMSKILGETGGIKVDMDHVGSPGCQHTSLERVRCVVWLTEGCLISKVVGSLSVGCWLSRLPTSSPP